MAPQAYDRDTSDERPRRTHRTLLYLNHPKHNKTVHCLPGALSACREQGWRDEWRTMIKRAMDR